MQALIMAHSAFIITRYMRQKGTTPTTTYLPTGYQGIVLAMHQ